MIASTISYSKGYKYQLKTTVVFHTAIRLSRDIETPLVALNADGWLIVKAGFAWDGCSGPTIDDRTNMRAGLAHDALYYLIRLGLLDIKWKDEADQLLYHLMICDGAYKWRAKYYKWAVGRFGDKAASSKGIRKVYKNGAKK